MSALLAAISETVTTCFLGIWGFILVCAASVGFFFSPYVQRTSLDSWSEPNVRYSSKLKNRDILFLALFVLFFAMYIRIQLWKQDFAYADDEQITEFSLRGNVFAAPVWPLAGRMFPLQLQEFNVLMHLSHSPTAFHTFAVLQLIAWALVTMASLSEFTIPRCVLAVFLIMSTLSFVTSFADLIYPERNILFWLALFILCRRRYSTTASRLFLAGTLISVQFALYYKEPVWLLFAGFAGTKLVCNWNATPRPRRVRSFIRENPADLGTMALAILFPLLFAVVMFRYGSSAYVATRRLALSATVLNYLKVDILLFVFLVVFAVRILRLLREGGKLDGLWDPLAVGAACYALTIVIGLRMFSGYYMAPVDAIAVLFLLQRMDAWLANKSAVRVIVVAACLVITIQNVAYAFVYITARKNSIAGQVQLAQFLARYIGERNNESVRIFFPYSSAYDLMETSAFLRYKGLPILDDAQGQKVSIMLESPLSFPQNRCVVYRADTCVHADAPRRGDLIAELAADDVPDGEMARNELFSYKPFLISRRSLLFFETLYSSHVPRHWLQVRVYQCDGEAEGWKASQRVTRGSDLQ